MFEKIKELAMEHGIGVAIGASLVGAVWATKSYLNNRAYNKLINATLADTVTSTVTTNEVSEKIVNSNQ